MWDDSNEGMEFQEQDDFETYNQNEALDYIHEGDEDEDAKEYDDTKELQLFAQNAVIESFAV